MSGAFSFNELIKLIILDQAYIKYMSLEVRFMEVRLRYAFKSKNSTQLPTRKTEKDRVPQLIKEALTVVAIVLLSIQLILSVKKKLTK